MKSASDVLKYLKDKDAKFVDLRFTDTKGKMQHVTADVSCIDEDMFKDGYAFDGSSIAGWKSIEASDMLLMPDPASAHVDPFFAQTTVAIFCDVIEPSTGQPYERDPRGIAKKAEAYMMSLGIGDKVYFGPEAEFFIFDDVQVLRRHVQRRLQARLRRSCPSTPPPTTRWATSATVRASRAATSRFRRSTAARTSAPRCCRC